MSKYRLAFGIIVTVVIWVASIGLGLLQMWFQFAAAVGIAISSTYSLYSAIKEDQTARRYYEDYPNLSPEEATSCEP